MRWFALTALLTSGCIMPNPDYDEGVAADTAGETDSLGTGGMTTTGPTTTAGTDSSSPTTGDLPPEGTVEMCTGQAHSCMRREDGSVWCWGENRFGQIGDGTHHTAHTPVEVQLNAAAVDIACGRVTTCAVLTDGSAWCWGANDDGILGFVGEPERTTPSQVPGAPALSDISVGDSHACARASGDGKVVCWGSNYRGQSGTDAPGPAYFGMLTGITKISSGDRHNCVLTADATVECWGEDDHGRLGAPLNEDLGFIPEPVDVGLTGVVDVQAGSYHTCALKDDGTAWCWGYNGSSMLGPLAEGDQTDTPVQFGNYAGVVSLAVGEYHTCVAVDSGVIYCHGSSWRGKLGNTTPLVVPNAVQLEAGDYNTCAIDDQDQVWCWGYDGSGQLAQGARWSSTAPVAVEGIGGGQVQQIAARGDATCVLLSSGSIQCWGANDSGMFGDGTSTDRPNPINSASSIAGTVTAIGVGYEHMCALDSEQTVWCWGSGGYGRLGNGDTTDSNAPVIAFTGATSLAVGGSHTCVTDVDAGVWCWGLGTSGELGDGLGTSSNVPVQVTGLTNVAQIAAGNNHTCAVLAETGELWCWGDNGSGNLGDGSRSDALVPIRPTDGNINVVKLALGGSNTCAISDTASLYCAGDTGEGKLGNPDVSYPYNFEKIADLGSTNDMISLGYSHSCRVQSGTLSCAGSNAFGQLGDGSYEQRTTFTQVESNIATVVAGGTHTCALTNGGAVRCFGDGYRGMLGEGTIARDTDVPVQVMFPPL